MRSSDLATLAAWPLPSTIGALVVSSPDGATLAVRLGGEVIAEGEGDVTVAFVPDPDAPGRRAQLETSLADLDSRRWGPRCVPGRGHHSLARARALHRLLSEGRIAADGLAPASTSTSPELLVHGGDRGLAGDLAARALEPLGELTPDGPQPSW